MLFGLNKQAPATPSPAAPAPAGAVIIDAGTADFEAKVIRESMQRPVLVDFWAPWCGPCKQLMPVLEAEVTAAGGAVVLAKVNIDENQQLAQMLRVQSVPTVYAFFQGQPVTAFQGAQPASQIRALIAELVKMARGAAPDAIDVPAALKDAAGFLAAGDVIGAQQLFTAVLTQDENNADAYAGLIRVMVAAGQPDQAQSLLDHVPDAIKHRPQIAAAATAVQLARELSGAGDPAALQQQYDADPANHQVALELAGILFARGRRQEAVDMLLDSIRREREWNDAAARKLLLRFFDALGPADPLSIQGRKKLSSLLFS